MDGRFFRYIVEGLEGYGRLGDGPYGHVQKFASGGEYIVRLDAAGDQSLVERSAGTGLRSDGADVILGNKVLLEEDVYDAHGEGIWFRV